MTFDELLESLPKWMEAGAGSDSGGLILLQIDRARQLREQLGFTGLAALQGQVLERATAAASGRVSALATGWERTLLVCHDCEGAAWPALLKKLRKSLGGKPYRVGDERLALTFSCASARFDYRFTSADEILLAVHEGVESISAKGGNEHLDLEAGVSASKALDSSNHMLGLLMEALQTGGMKVVFQPLLATDNSEPFENHQMLPRLGASDGTLIAAAEFLPLAREANLLPVLDRWMTLHALRLLKGPLGGRPVRLFVNQSDALLRDTERMDWLTGQLGVLAGLDGRIVIEVRHDDALSHLRGTTRLMALARDHGASVCVSMVDENSRWDLLADELSCEFVRMSPGFVARLTKDVSLEKRFLALSETPREQGTRVIMPMIEDPETAASMWRSGADFMQGNMIQAPEDTI